MMKPMMNRSDASLLGLLLGVSLLLTACAAAQKSPEEAVEARAEQRLAAVLAEDYATDYGFLSPGYRSGVTLAQHQRNMALRKVRWTDATVAGSECSEDVCKVRISIEYEVYGAVPGMSRFKSLGAAEEDWIFSGGDWYLVPAE
jgi:hypothetical protein